MRLALREAERALEHDDVPIGAVIVRDGEVLAAACNERELRSDPTAHAEILALREAGQKLGGWRIPDSVLYVTIEPCAMCAGAIVWARRAAAWSTARRTPRPAPRAACSTCSASRASTGSPEVAGGLLADECGGADVGLLRDPPLGRRRSAPPRVPLRSRRSSGGVPERLNGAVSKTVVGASPPRVRIPPPPLYGAGTRLRKRVPAPARPPGRLRSRESQLPGGISVTERPRDQVDQYPEQRKDEYQQYPGGLGRAGQVVAPEDVGEHADEHPDEHEHEGEGDHRYQQIAEVKVARREDHVGFLFGLRGNRQPDGCGRRTLRDSTGPLRSSQSIRRIRHVACNACVLRTGNGAP